VQLLADDVVPACSPQLMCGQTTLAPLVIAQLTLLQQSTRPDGWRRWFDAMDLLALLPRRLIEAERADCARP